MKKVLVLLGLVCLLGACGTSDKMSLAKQSPDEFMVMSRAPLYLPPEYDNRPLAPMAKQKTFQSKLSGLSKGEQAFLKQLNAQKTNDNIRAELNQEMSAKHE